MFGKTISRVFVWESDLFVVISFKKNQWNQERRKKNENISKFMNFY